MRRHSSGFTIVELMIAMVVLMIVTAMAIPQYLSAIQRGHEAAAVSYLRQVQTAQEAYQLANHEYADTFAKLQPYVSAHLEMPPLPDGGLDSFATVAFAAPLQQGTPPGQGGTPPGQGGTPPGQGGTPPGQGGTPPGQGGTPPGQGGTPPGQGGTPPGQGGAPPGSTGTPSSDTKLYSLYIFTLTRPDTSHWNCTAEPVRNRLNSRFYYSDETLSIRYAFGALADALSPQI